MTTKKQTLFIVIAILLVIGGTTVFVKDGIMRVMDDTTYKNNFQCGNFWRCIPYDTEYSVMKNETLITDLVITIDFRTDGEFAVDNRINYIIDVVADKPNMVQKIEFMIAFTDKNYTDLTKIEFEEVRKDAKEHRRWIYLDTLSSTHFYDKDFFTIPIEGKISLIGFVTDYENKVQVIPKSEKLLDIKPHTDYMIAKQVIELETYNRLILGLAYMGITIPFILVGADILLRIYLGEKAIRNNSDDELDQCKKPCKDHSKFYR